MTKTTMPPTASDNEKPRVTLTQYNGEQLDCASDYVAWINSIAWAIGAALEKGNKDHAQRLAEAAQHLTGDYQFQLESDVRTLTKRLDALDMRA